jgi:hypothetical protein
MGENFREEIFFFMYHMNIPKKDVLELEPEERKWIINRFVEQKKKENEEIERAKAKAKSQSKHK